jgi:hypothetical protein
MKSRNPEARDTQERVRINLLVLLLFRVFHAGTDVPQHLATADSLAR